MRLPRSVFHIHKYVGEIAAGRQLCFRLRSCLYRPDPDSCRSWPASAPCHQTLPYRLTVADGCGINRSGGRSRRAAARPCCYSIAQYSLSCYMPPVSQQARTMPAVLTAYPPSRFLIHDVALSIVVVKNACRSEQRSEPAVLEVLIVQTGILPRTAARRWMRLDAACLRFVSVARAAFACGMDDATLTLFFRRQLEDVIGQQLPMVAVVAVETTAASARRIPTDHSVA